MSIGEVSHIVSIGAACMSTFQLRRYFNFGLAFPFDWWVTTPTGIIRALNSDVYTLDEMEDVFINGEISTVRTRDGHIGFHHDFPRAYETPGIPILPNWRDSIVPARERFLRRRERLYEIDKSGNTILFVRHCRDEENQSEELVANIRGRFEKSRCIFLFLNSSERAQTPDVHHASFRPLPQPTWSGTDSEWDAVLSGLGVSLNNSEMHPFSGVLDMLHAV